MRREGCAYLIPSYSLIPLLT